MEARLSLEEPQRLDADIDRAFEETNRQRRHLLQPYSRKSPLSLGAILRNEIERLLPTPNDSEDSVRL